MSGGSLAILLKLLLEIRTWTLNEIVQRGEHLSEQDMDVVMQKIRLLQNIGLVVCGQINQSVKLQSKDNEAQS